MESAKITFWGVELNEEELKTHRLSYATISKTFNAVLCNEIVNVDECLYDNIESGDIYDYYVEGEEATYEEYTQAEEEGKECNYELVEVFQYYIIDASALWVLQRMGELVFYSYKLDCYVWGVTHWGTSWDYVMTNLKLSDDYSHLED